MLIGEIFIIEGKAYAHHYSDAGYKVVYVVSSKELYR